MILSGKRGWGLCGVYLQADLPSSAKAYVAGVVFTISYDQGPWSIYGNAAYSSAMGSDIIYAQFNFAPDELLT
jgi:hypothetical protein